MLLESLPVIPNLAGYSGVVINIKNEISSSVSESDLNNGNCLLANIGNDTVIIRILKLTDYVQGNLDSGSKYLAIFLDLANVFGTVSVPLLLNKLYYIGLRGLQVQRKLLEDYLTDRFQCVRVGDYTSSDQPVSNGVPQGSILGPILFLVYINDISHHLSLNSGKLVTYADVTAFVVADKNWDETYDGAQKGLNNVTEWLRDNILTLNADKTQYICFSIRSPNTISDVSYIKAQTCLQDDNGQCPYSLVSCSGLKWLNIWEL